MSAGNSMNYLNELTLPLGLVLAVVLIGAILRRLIFSRLHRWAQKTESQYDDIIISAIKGSFLLWCLAVGVYAALQVSDLPADLVELGGKLLLALVIGSITLTLANLSTRLIEHYARNGGRGLPVTSLSQNVVRGFILGTGILIILNSLGISIAPLLTAMGIGGLAVALALQDTLANLFAGIYISLSKQVQPGEYVKLESGEEGYVTDMDWRSTKIRALPNNMIIVPNSKLASSIVINYYQPDKELAVLINVGVDYSSNLKKVEEVTIAAGREIMQTVSGGVPEFTPFIRYHTFGDSSIQFTVILRAREFVDQYLIKHEFVKLLHERYRQEGIVVPFPIRTVFWGKS